MLAFLVFAAVFVIVLEEVGLGGEEEAEEEDDDDEDEEDDDDDDDDDDDEDDDDEEEVSDSSSELESIFLTFTMGRFNDGRIVGDFRTTRPGKDIGCDRFRFLTRLGSSRSSNFSLTQIRSPSLTAPNGLSSSNSKSSTKSATSCACTPPSLKPCTRRHSEFFSSKIDCGTFCTSGTNHALTSGSGL